MPRTGPTVTALTLTGALAACGTGDRPEAESATPEFVVLVDDGSDDGDVIEGEPGAYGLTPRGTSAAPYAVIDVPGGYASFGTWAAWPLLREDDDEEGDFSAVEYWAVHGVYDDPADGRGRRPRSVLPSTTW